MKIGYICSEYPPGAHGGIGTVTQLLARALVSHGHAVRVAGVYAKSCAAPDYEEDQGVQVWRHRVPQFRFDWLLDRWRLWRIAVRWARRQEVDVIEVPDWQGFGAYWPRLRVPVVVRVHGSVSSVAAANGQTIRPVDYRWERATLRRADAWCAVSQYAAGRTRKVFMLETQPSAILYNPLDLPARATPQAERQSNQVIFAGTLTANKGVISLIEAWPRVLAVVPQAELHLYGKSGRAPNGEPMQPHLVARLPESVRASVSFHGHIPREQLSRALARARVAVFPSHSETFGLAPLEAMATGCPTIYTKLSCGPEMVRHGLDGILVDPRQPAEIADALVQVLADDALAERLGAQGRQTVAERFSLAKIVVQNEVFYRDCIRRFRTS